MKYINVQVCATIGKQLVPSVLSYNQAIPMNIYIQPAERNVVLTPHR